MPADEQSVEYPSLPEHLGVVMPVKCVRVLDGDTIEVEYRARAVVRLKDCWASELRRGSEESRADGVLALRALEAMADGRDGILTVQTENADAVGDVFSFGRAVGYFFPEGTPGSKSVNEMMVEQGFATARRAER